MPAEQDIDYYLEHFLQKDGVLSQVPLPRLPFCIGRNGGSDYIIASRDVSKRHVEFFLRQDQLHVRDLGSTNGTFLNGAPVTEAALQDGDILHVATHELRVVFGAPVSGCDQAEVTCRKSLARPQNIFYQDLLREILREKTVRTVFQPVVRLHDRATVGYEALGRVITDDMNVNTGELFSVANLCESASDLSRIFRSVAFRDAVRIPGEYYFFVNVHPVELAEAYFLTLLRDALLDLPERCKVVLEIHEDTMVDSAALCRFHQQVKEMGLKVAYDDFGAGQPRLAELAEAPPDFIKLDMKLVRGIDQSSGRQELIKALRQLSSQQNITMIAEGIETQQEADMCRDLGCELAQGYLLGRPQSVSLFVKAGRTEELDLGAVRRELKRRTLECGN